MTENIEKKWQKKWENDKLFESDPNDKEKLFLTVAFPYPSGAMHIGHGRTYTVPDVYPTLYCVESFGYDNIYEDDNIWTCTTNECKDAAVEFWERFGYKLTFKKVGDVNAGTI